MENDKIGCIILNYNDAETTMKLVKEMSRYACLNTIVIVDNGSTDCSFEQLEALKEENHIYVIKTTNNLGYGMGNQAGIDFCIKKSLADYLIIANPDIHIQEKSILRIKEGLDHTEGSAVASASVVSPQGKKLFSYWMLVSPFKELLDTGLVTRRVFRTWLNTKQEDLQPGGEEGCYLVGAVPGSFFMIKCSELSEEQISHLFDPGVFLYQEEKILGQKMCQWRKKIVLVTDTFYIHAHSVSINKSYSNIADKQKILHRSKLYYFKKYLHVGKTGMVLIRLALNWILIEVWVLTNVFHMKW